MGEVKEVSEGKSEGEREREGMDEREVRWRWRG